MMIFTSFIVYPKHGTFSVCLLARIRHVELTNLLIHLSRHCCALLLLLCFPYKHANLSFEPILARSSHERSVNGAEFNVIKKTFYLISISHSSPRQPTSQHCMNKYATLYDYFILQCKFIDYGTTACDCLPSP